MCGMAEAKKCIGRQSFWKERRKMEEVYVEDRKTIRKKAFIFDLDGVLVFTDKYHYLAWKELADRLGIYFDETINHRLRGVSRMDSLEIILERAAESYTDEQKEAFATEKNETYKKLLEKMTPADVSWEVRHTLAQLKSRGHKLAIGSSSKNAKFILKQVDLLDMFDAVSDGTNITKSKPDPEVFLKAADFLGEEYDNCVVVEDAYAGVDAAKSGNMLCAGIGDARGYEKTDYPLDKFSDILKIAE